MFRIALQGKARAALTEQKNRAWLAHTTASLVAFAHHKPKAMPALDTLTGEKRHPRIQSPDEMKAVFAAMRASWRSQ